ncbi:MAG TPA: flagellar hook capping FlgD N-terminal domain-containing protein [Dissulfurispiraceae bacterium]|nr:flagellar hook capping FlgD N-terminal domain-containing protein [Dissulfurispiraceae bacterium]
MASSISSILNNPAYTGTASTTTKKSNSELDQQDFMNLLITQLKNQDPLNPMKDTEFIAQLASFNSLKEMTSVNTNLQKLLTAQNSQNSAVAVGLIGKEIVDVNGTKGTVTSVSIADDGTVNLVVNGSKISYSDVRTVSNPTTT